VCRRIGTEHEKLGFNLADNSRMDYEHIQGVFERLESRFGWQPMTEAGLTIGETIRLVGGRRGNTSSSSSNIQLC
jgi:gamma-glutamylcysteine synthetase